MKRIPRQLEPSVNPKPRSTWQAYVRKLTRSYEPPVIQSTQPLRGLRAHGHIVHINVTVAVSTPKQARRVAVGLRRALEEDVPASGYWNMGAQVRRRRA